MQPGGEMLPVGGISWQNAAIYMNWLHNGKGTQAADFMSGAYDVSTFGRDPADPSSFTDQTTRSPGARYWIPSLDEWTKAAHWDPNKNGSGQGGYWEFNNASDTQPVPGLPGVGETTADLFVDDAVAFSVPLESYPETQSPWGLLDLSGGGAEWTEEWFTRNSPDERQIRYWQGAGAGNTTIAGGDTNFDPIFQIDRTPDRIWEVGADRPDEPTRGFVTFRVASAIPAPGVGVPLLAIALFAPRRRAP
ncbi:MAG: SUMF1/EgtB/PvdO family nonheme iron enzyme [Planctomycetota bacterium]